MTATAPMIKKVSRHTLHTEVTSQLRDLIVQGHFQPGERLNEVRIGSEMGVSRTPLREAIRTLGSEGLLEVIPNRGAAVRAYSFQEVLDMVEAQSLIEQGCAALCCERATEADIRLFAERNRDLLATYKARDRLPYFQINQDLHAMLVTFARNATLRVAHADLQAKLKRVRFLGNDEPTIWARAVAEHKAINDAIQRRDDVKLVEVLKAHKLLTIERLRSSSSGESL